MNLYDRRLVVSVRSFLIAPALALSLVFLMAPLAPAFAQEAVGGTISGDSQGSSDQTTVTATSSSVGTSTPSPSAPPSSLMPATLVGPTSSDILNSGNTDIAKHLSPTIDQFSGAMSYTYPIDIPAGRSGMTPNASLVYSSQSTDSQSIWGLGWTDAIPFITQVSRHGADQLYTTANYIFSSSVDGELTQLTSTGGGLHPEYGTYVSKSEIGDFNAYTYSSGVWTVTDKRGTVYTYGSSAASRQDDPSSSANIYKWMLSKTTDTNNNFISYTYFKNAGQIYPDTITYTGNGSTAGIYEIDYVHTARTDSINSFASAFSNYPAYHISEIDVKVSGVLRKKFALSYSSNSNGAQSLLVSITETGYDASLTPTTLPAETFDYNQVSSHTWTLDPSWSLPVDASPTTTLSGGGTPHVFLDSAPTSASYGSAVMADINGDGLPDIVQSWVNNNSSTYTEIQNVYLNTGSGWVLDPTWSFPIDAGTGGTLSGGGTSHVALHQTSSGLATVQLSDVNGDGLPDLVQSWQYNSGTPTEVQNIYINNGHGWTLDPTWNTPVDAVGTTLLGGGSSHVFLNGTTSSYGTAVLQDVNGDGLPDLVQAWLNNNTSSLSEIQNVYINNGHGWTLDPTWNMPVDAAGGTLSGGGSSHVSLSNTLPSVGPAIFMDVNGDGLADVVQSWHSSAGTGIYTEIQNVYVNNGHGWTLDPTWHFPVDPVAASSGYTLSGGGSLNIGLNGTGFTVTPMDVNGDGLPDFVQSWHYDSTPGTQVEYDNVFINTGNGWVLDPTWSFPTDAGSSAVISGTSTPVHIGLNRDGFLVTPVDVNADQLYDFVQSWHSGTGTVTETENIYRNGGPLALLSKITLPSGGTEQVMYKPVATAGSSNMVPIKIPVVSSVTLTDPVLGITGTDVYSYTGGTYRVDDPFTHKFAGFQMVQKTNAAGNVTRTYFHTGNGTDTTHGEFADDEAKIGKVYRTEWLDGSENLFKVVINKWDSYVVSTGHEFVKLARTTTETFDGGTTHRDTAQEYSYDNSNGNLLQTIDWGEVTAAMDGSFTDIGTDKSTENITYAIPTSGSVIGLPSDDTVLDQSGTVVRETRNYYDSLSLGSVTSGNQTKEEKLKSGTVYVNTQKTYGTDGFVTSSTDEDGNTTTYTPDSHYLYPITITDPLTYTKNYVYDYALGKPTQVTDENGFVYNTAYDGLGRTLTESIPDPSSGVSVLKTSYTYTDTPLAVSIQKTDTLGTVSVNSYQYEDGLGRLIQTRTSSEIAGTYNVSDTAYNNVGQKSKESLPYASSGTSRTSPTTTTALYTIYAYDPLARVTTSTSAAGTTTNAYFHWNTTVTDPMSHVKEYRKDARDNLVQVAEHNGTSVYTTTYTWDLNGKLTSMTDASGNVRNFGYDKLGRRLLAEDLHDSADTTYGTWLFTYDNAGNMTQSVNPNGATVNYTYDGLNRRLTENWTGGTGTEITYAYDTCTNGVTKLCTVTMLSGANTSYRYDADGNIAREARTIGTSGTFTTRYTHDRQGNIVTLGYPDGAAATYTYGTNGLPATIDRNESGGPTLNVITGVSYAPTSQPSQVQYANGVTTTNTYDASHLYRLSNKLTVNGSSVHLQDTSYTYDSDGDITALADVSANDNARTVNYTYDDLNRLLTAGTTSVASGTPTYADTFTYDPIGNISSGPLGSYAYTGSTGTNYANPHAVTSTGSDTYTYDNDGNLLTSSDTSKAWNYVWNYKDQATEIDYGTAMSQATYDQDGNRVSNYWGAGTDYYPNKYYKLDQTGDITKDIYMGNQLAATINTSGTTVTPYYVHTDDILGSNVVTDGSGTQNQLLDYYPYGDVRLNEQTGSFNEEKQFGGHYYDNQQKLSYLGARYYDPIMSRFVSEDPSFLALGNEGIVMADTGRELQQYLSDPQALNSYSYARENPITVIDPNGKAFVLDDIAGIAVGAMAGFLFQMGTSLLVQHHLPTGGEMAGSVVTGAITGEGLVNTPETAGASDVAASAIISAMKVGGRAAFAGNVTKQVVDNSTGMQSGYSLKELAGCTVLGSATAGTLEGALPDAEIPGLSSGRGNPYSIGQGLQTKLANGTISGMSFNTAIKSAVGSQAADAYRTIGGGLIDGIKSSFESEKK